MSSLSHSLSVLLPLLEVRWERRGDGREYEVSERVSPDDVEERRRFGILAGLRMLVRRLLRISLLRLVVRCNNEEAAVYRPLLRVGIVAVPLTLVQAESLTTVFGEIAGELTSDSSS